MPTKETNWIAFAYTTDTVRVFNCNAIIFHNRANEGGLEVIINDLYILKPNEERTLRSQYNDTDRTAYRMIIPTGAILQGFYKMDAGVFEDERQKIIDFLKVKMPDIREFSKQYRLDSDIPQSSIEQAYNMDITGLYGNE